MDHKQRCKKTAALLLAWFAENARALPWRRTRDPYAIWVSEIMLQQTQVETVWPYYERFLQRFPTIDRLARARLDTVLTTVQHAYSHFRVTIHTFECEHLSGKPQPIHCVACKWVWPSQSDNYAFPRANRKILAALSEDKKRGQGLTIN